MQENGLDRTGKQKWSKIQPLWGEEQARQYCLKVLNRPADDKTSLGDLYDLVIERQIAHLAKLKQTAFSLLSHQSAKTIALFLKGVSEGYTIFLNTEGEFSADDRRADIHLELLACQYEIEKMRKAIPHKTSNHLTSRLRQVPEFKNKTRDWFQDVFKDIKLSIGPRGRPWGNSGT